MGPATSGCICRGPRSGDIQGDADLLQPLDPHPVGELLEPGVRLEGEDVSARGVVADAVAVGVVAGSRHFRMGGGEIEGSAARRVGGRPRSRRGPGARTSRTRNRLPTGRGGGCRSAPNVRRRRRGSRPGGRGRRRREGRRGSSRCTRPRSRTAPRPTRGASSGSARYRSTCSRELGASKIPSTVPSSMPRLPPRDASCIGTRCDRRRRDEGRRWTASTTSVEPGSAIRG